MILSHLLQEPFEQGEHNVVHLTGPSKAKNVVGIANDPGLLLQGVHHRDHFVVRFGAVRRRYFVRCLS